MEGKASRSRVCRSLRLSLAWGVLSLAACTTLPTTPRDQAEAQRLWVARQPLLAQRQTWSIAGRLALQTERQGWHIAFRWKQQGGFYHIVLSDPLGQTAAELQGNPQGVTLLMADGRSVTAADPDQLLARQLGWPVPIQGLYYWVRGLPVPDAPETHGLDREGRLLWLKQSGWDISYRRYGDSAGLALPTKVFLDNDRLKVRVVIDNWT